MAQAHIGELPEGTKRCKVCQEPINAKAEKCIHCSSDQTWRLRLGFSATILALLVALVTVLGAAAPVIKDLLLPTNSNLVATFQGADTKSTTEHLALHVLVSNTGNRPGTVTADTSFLFSDEWDVPGLAVRLVEPARPTERVVEAGKFALLTFSITASLDRLKDVAQKVVKSLRDKKTERCRLLVSSVDNKGKPKSQWVELNCLSVLFEWYASAGCAQSVPDRDPNLVCEGPVRGMHVSE